MPPATIGRLNHALIKPWSEFELGHYPLTVINAAALLGGQGRQWGRDVRHATHTDARIKSLWLEVLLFTLHAWMETVCIVSMTTKMLLILGKTHYKKRYKKASSNNPLAYTLSSNQSGKWWVSRYDNPALDAWWDITKVLQNPSLEGEKEMEILILPYQDA